MSGLYPWPVPAVCGHEGAGIVAEVGAAVTHVRPGDHVIIATLAACGFCEQCNNGRPTSCRQTLGNATENFTLEGKGVVNFAGASVFADRTVVRDIQAVKIPDDVPLTSAALVGCGVVTGMLVRAEVTRAAVYAAACAIDGRSDDDPGRAAAVAKVVAGDAALENARTCIQVHGGIGYTWELDVQRYWKRASVLDTHFGNRDECAQTIAVMADRWSSAGPSSNSSAKDSASSDSRALVDTASAISRAGRKCSSCTARR